jgi:peptide-methionine (S)-S-oxide reductase
MTSDNQTEVAVLAGGCFWGVEDILRAVPGVLDTDVGYTGGWLENPTYHDTHGSKSGHAESVRIEFDPSVLSYESLLEDWFFKLHDPTTLNRQGNDIGTQYRSAIYPTTDGQLAAAEDSRTRYQQALKEAGFGEISTEIRPAAEAGTFWYAEDYHQGYLHKNPRGYCNHGFCQVAYNPAAHGQDAPTKVTLPEA